jgi:hypothetical protein
MFCIHLVWTLECMHRPVGSAHNDILHPDLNLLMATTRRATFDGQNLSKIRNSCLK